MHPAARLLVMGKKTAAGDVTAPTITSSASASIAENAVLAHALTADESVTWSIVGGTDAADLEISGSTLRWVSNGTKDYEVPDDSNTNNTYVVDVRATDGSSNTTDQTITVTVTDVATDLAILPWTPADAAGGTITAWWDPGDASTLTWSDDARVDEIEDKSGNGHDLTGTTTTRPNFNYDWVGKEAIGFDGTGDVLVSDSVTQAQPLTIYQATYIFTGFGGDYKTAFDGAGTVLVRGKQALTALLFAGSAYTPTIWAEQQQIVKARFASSTGYQSLNGAAETSGAVGAGTISGVVRLGDSATGDAPFTGFIGETVLLNADVTEGSDLDDRMTGYMAWGNGTFESLPGAHAYRYAAPKVGITPAVPDVTRTVGEFIDGGDPGAWCDTNIFDPCIVEHPSDATKLLLFASGQTEPPGTGVASIGRFIIDKSDPLATPTFTAVVLTKGTGGDWDNAAAGVRLGSVINVGGTLYMYYCSQQSGTPANEIGLATSTDDGVTFTKTGAALLSPTGDESCLGEPAIWWEGGTATIIYDYRTGSDPEDILPGYRYATASALTGPFTKDTGPDILRRPRLNLHCEARQILKKGGRYYLLCEVGGNPTDATPYRLYLASCATLTGRYTFEKLVLAEAGSGSSYGDKYHVATPCYYTIAGQDYLFWTGAPDFDQPYVDNRWNMYAGEISGVFDVT